MKILFLSLCIFAQWACSEGLQCWTCSNAKTNEECIENGKLQKCEHNENACHNEVRRGDKGILITKRCKQDWACTNNEIQNLKNAWEPTQCNSKVPSSVCRCCCVKDGCNKHGLRCKSQQNEPSCPPMDTPTFGRKICRFFNFENELDSLCAFQCNTGYNRIGADSSRCVMKDGENKARYTRPVPKCLPKPIRCPPMNAPKYGNKNCRFENDEHEVGSQCAFACNREYNLIGADSTKCVLDVSKNRARFTRPVPKCIPKPRRCRMLKSPRHGRKNCQFSNHETEVGSLCTFRCNNGYDLVGADSSLCVQHFSQNKARFNRRAPTCARKIVACKPQRTPAHGNVSCTDGLKIGSVCTYTCDPFHVLQGLDVLICDRPGIWDGIPPACVQVSCPSLSPPINGSFSCSYGMNEDSECRFSCIEGYKVVGASSTVCRHFATEGLWSEEVPACERIRCSEMTAVDNGNHACSDGDFLHSECEFSCNANYQRVGPLSTRCVLDEQGKENWNNDAPVCERIRCSEITLLDNGYYGCSDAEFLHSECEFFCDDDYRRVGALSTRCVLDSNGVEMWDEEHPVCERIKCPEIPEIINGYYDCSDSEFLRSECDFLCEEEYRRVGATSTRCFLNEEGVESWSNEIPVCERIRCSEIEKLDNGYHKCNDGDFLNSECEFKCNDGYRRVGPSNTRCIEDENGIEGWEKETPVCQRIRCSEIVPLENGNYECSDAEFLHSECIFRCNDDYRIVGPLSTRCVVNGNLVEEWENETPICERSRCSEIKSLDNGYYNCSDGNFLHSECEFTCDDISRRIGSSSTRCVLNENGVEVWENERPTCQRIRCSKLVLTNGYYTCSKGDELHSECRFACHDDYMRVGALSTRCFLNENGVEAWDNETPTCQRMKCAEIGTIYNGDSMCSDSNYLHSECVFSCDSEYRREGALTAICILDAEGVAGWDNDAPLCRTPTCNPQRGPAHGNVSCTNGLMIGSVCTYTCDPFHVLEGSDTTVCNHPGTWDAIPPACVAVSCPKLSPPINGSFSCSYGMNEDSECRFSCVEGYKVTGSPSTICRHSATEGVWSESLPTCERIKCSEIAEPDNGYFTCSNGEWWDSECEFECHENYQGIGELRTRCIVDENGVEKWDNQPPVCEEIRCTSQDYLNNGEVSCTNGNSVGSVCSFRCTAEDFVLTPSDITTNWCLNDSAWSLSKPCCGRVCPPHAPLDLVIAIDSSSSIGQESWETIKDFVKSLLDIFVIGEDSARIGIFRYNKYVDRKNQILLRDFPNDKEGLLRAFDEIPYNGRGTFTGRALGHARRVMLDPRNGNRPDVPDYVLVITDGQSRDQVKTVASKLHADGVHVIAVGVVPPKGQLDLSQLKEIVNHEEDLVIAERGFEDLNLNIFQDLVHTFCVPGC